MHVSRMCLAGTLVVGLVGSTLAVGAPAQADVSNKFTLPYAQDWSNAGLITTSNDWSGVTGVQGYRGDNLATAAADPQTVTADGSATPTNVTANNTGTLSTNTTGGIIEHEPSQAIALQGSGTADLPHLVFHLDLTDTSDTTFSFDAKDLDAAADNAVQQIAVQYRIGSSGAYTNLPTGYIPDATTAGTATQVTHRDVALPAATDGQADVYVRVQTADATGSDEWVGIDNITVTEGDPEPLPLSATDPSDATAMVGTPIAPISLQASGGTSPYGWQVTGLPAGLTETSDGVIGGTPTEAGVFTVTATVTDSTAATDSVDFTITVQGAPLTATIAEVQGTGPASPLVGQRVTVQGVVTGRYPNGTGNLAGFYLQTGGPDGTPGASDALFVFSGAKTAPAIGASVEVTGEVEERFESTQIAAPSFTTDPITVLPSPLPAVVPGDTLPGTDCALPGTDCLTGAALEAAREAHEGEAYLPTGPYTVTDSYDGTPFTQDSSRAFQMQGEFGLAANSPQPLMIPTETIDQSDTAGLAARRAWNDAHTVILDDGADIDYTANTNNSEDTPFPWLTPGNPVRVGAPVAFQRPVILEFRRDLWRVQPETKVAGGSTGADLVEFDNTRTNAPEDVLGATGDLKIATFNMLNYFNTFGEAWAASDGTATGGPGTTYNFLNPRRCNYFLDRGPAGGASATNRLTNDECTEDSVDPLTGLNVKLPGPRGAANEPSFLRQEAKELEAINTIDADVMSLEEVENSVKLYNATIDGADGADKDRDDALRRLVQQLNAHWLAAHPGETNRWAFVPSPRPEALPTIAEQDAIRSAFIYNPSKVEPVGRSQVLVGSAPFRNAREPLAQAFKPLGGGRADAFGVVVNHFKSKGGPTAPATVNGDNVDTGDGAGFYNGDRKRQAAALVAFADQFAADKNIEPMFLSGDFNSYSAEDPVQVIEAAHYENLKPSNGETTYSFGGLAGSLDHVFANEAARAMVTGEDVWSINANESVYYEYSRYNANATDLYTVNPFRSSDHNPEIVGIDVGDNVPDPDVDTVQVLATNDFHGRLLDDPNSAAAGAASLAGAVKQLRTENPDTVFAAAGDLIGASTFESFIQNDEPTIDALNEAGLEVSAVGNHEFDQGYDDLVTRVMPHASWEYIGANVEFKHTEDGHTAGEAALPETWCQTLDNGRVIGFVGAVTEDLPALVAGSGIEDIVVTDVVDAVNENADELKGQDGCGAAGPADLVVELVHEGAASTSYAAVTDDSVFGRIVAGANENVDAIVSGHTHLSYNHKVSVQAWEDEGRAVTARPVVSAGQYGANLNRLEFEFAPGGGELVNIRQTVLQLKDYDADPATQDIVDDAAAYAETAGNVVLGSIEDPFVRARRNGDVAGQVVENRGGESTLGNVIAEMQRWKTGADIGLMNPGGLRADLLGNTGDPREVTYRQAANAQPFANTLVTMDLTGAQIKTILEQQWQRDADGNIPSRPFLRLGTSDGFTSTFDASRPEGERITGMWLDGVKVGATTTYRVSATSFLAGSGDNFWGFGDATDKQDTGKTDLQAVVDYLEEFATANALQVDYGQHAVGVDFTGTVPAEYVPGNVLAFDLSSLAMTGTDDVQDSQVQVLLDGNILGTFAVNNALTNEPDDRAGTASVSVVVPGTVGDGTTEFVVRGVTTGTEVPIVVPTSDGLPDTTISADDTSVVYGQAVSVHVTVSPSAATGEVTLRDGDTVLGTGLLAGGATDIGLAAGALEVGDHDLVLDYPGDPGSYSGDRGQVRITVTKAASTTTTTVAPAQVVVLDGVATVKATVSAAGYTPTGLVEFYVAGELFTTVWLADGKATVPLDPFQTTGIRTITVRYLGDTNTLPSQSVGGSVTVVKATPTMTVTTSPQRISVKSTVVMTVALTAPSQVPAGTVTVTWGKKKVVGTLSSGQVQLRLGEFDPPGTYTFQVSYSGSQTVEAATTTTTITVVKK